MSAMRFGRIELRNWKNFPKVDVVLASRVFLIGPNASGKSNFLDAFRFLRDLVTEGGGLAKAVQARDGMSKLRSLYARGTNAFVSIAVDVVNAEKGWHYELAFSHASVKRPFPQVVHESVTLRDGTHRQTLFKRPDDGDEHDPERRAQTFIQQVSQNKEFRELADFFRGVFYLHLVPQLVREGQPPLADRIGLDQYGRDLLDRIRNTPERTRNARLNRIQKVIGIVAAPLEDLSFTEDTHGRPHLQVKFRHWRPQGAYQNETQFSDGTLRLIGLLWSLQEKAGPLLLEEPELSLHPAVVRKLAPFIHRAQRAGNGRQVILSTHSDDLLMDPGIGADELLLVRPTNEGSEVVVGATLKDVSRLMNAGIPASEAVLPLTGAEQLSLFETADI